MLNRKRKCCLIVVLLLACIGPVGQAHAATAGPPANGITVSPAQLNFILDSKPSQTIPVTITNSYASPVILGAELKGIDEAAGRLLPAGNLSPAVTSALHLSQTEINLAAGQSQTIQVQVNNSHDLGPGGYYATVVLTQLGGARQLSLNAAISLSVFIIKPNGAHTSLQASNLQTNGWLFSSPTIARLDFNNNGNVHVIPRAVVTVSGQKNQLLAQGIANADSLPLLPGSHFISSVPLTTLHRSWLPVHITTTVTYRADGADTTSSLQHRRWYIPPIDVLIVVLFISAAYRVLIYRLQRAKRHSTPHPMKPKPTAPLPGMTVAPKPSRRAIAVTDTTPDSVTLTLASKSVGKEPTKAKPKAKKTTKSKRKPKK